mgnify:CR=1 FL=1
MSRNESSRIEYWFFMLTLYVFVVLVIYACHFHACKLSNCTTDWGAFGSYFGGMVSIVSIILLYLTLREQMKENYRIQIENGYNRILYAICQKYDSNKREINGILHEIYCCAIDEKKDERDTSDKVAYNVRQKLNDIYSNLMKRNAIQNLYDSFVYLILGIRDEEDLDASRKKHYLQNMEHSLPMQINIIILLHLIYLNKNKNRTNDGDMSLDSCVKDIIGIIKDNELYTSLRFGTKYLDTEMKYMFGYDDSQIETKVSTLFFLYSK